VHKGFRCGILNKGGHLLDLGGRSEDDIKIDNQEIGWGNAIGTRVGLVCTR
jgi:hypothetical protein